MFCFQHNSKSLLFAVLNNLFSPRNNNVTIKQGQLFLHGRVWGFVAVKMYSSVTKEPVCGLLE